MTSQIHKELLSVVVIAKNEEANIDSCLGSVHGWADEIILVDDESTLIAGHVPIY